MSDLYKKKLTDERKQYIASKALELREKYNLSSSIIAERLCLSDRSQLRQILIAYGVWEKFKANGA